MRDFMGVYFKVACDEAKECIDPGSINDLGVKAGSIAHPEHPFGPVVVYATLHRWHSPIRLANDSHDDPGYYDYLDVTEEVLREYNQTYNTHFRFTGKPRRPNSTNP